jgi:nucleoside-diphosphate kinase
MGKTSGLEAEPGTIRGDLGVSPQRNLIHGSDSPEAARREIKLYFKARELFQYDMPDREWLGGE